LIGRIRRTSVLLGALLLVAAALPALASAQTATLVSGGTLRAGQDIVSPDGHYELVMQSDGNLVEYIVGGRALWSTGTSGNGGARAVLQTNGNLVVYAPSNAVLWSSNSHASGCAHLVVQDDGQVILATSSSFWTNDAVQSYLQPGDVLQPGWGLYSPPPEEFHLIMQGDGNLVVYDADGRPLWNAGTEGHPGAWAVMQTDGNFVVYNTAGQPLWNAGTEGHGGAFAVIQGDGNLVVYAGGKALWDTETNGKGAGGSQAPGLPAAPTCPPPPPPPPPPPAVVNVPHTTAFPVPSIPRELAVLLRISWTWNHRTTRLHRARIGSFPGRAQIFVQCRGKGCPGKRDISAHGSRNVRRLLRGLRGDRYRAGDRVVIILKAPGYLPERAMVRILDGRLPQITLLPS
jgi:hypothetical protein